MCPWGPNSFIFMQFLAKNLQNIRLVYPLWGVGTPSGKSWICHYRSGTVNSKSFVGKVLFELSGNSN